jgi:L-ribulose-5-phosphate 4-epimerase
MRLEALRRELVDLHDELPRNGLVVWTGGNISARDPGTGLVAIKPSGVRYGELTPDSMVVVDLDGNVVEGDLKPSSDTASHLYIYRHRPDVNGVVHTHSRFATAFAAVGRSIPVYLTGHADEFGGEIPCAPFAFIGDDSIGSLVVEGIGRSRAILLKNHGVFTIGSSARSAVKSAVMVEDVAATVFFALQLGTPEVLPDEAVERLHRRYTTVYGQQPPDPSTEAAAGTGVTASSDAIGT